MGIYGTRSHGRWSSTPGRLDALNLQHLYESSSQYGIPDLGACYAKPAALVAWNDARHSTEAAVNRSFHFFLDDYRFESVWRFPERYLKRIQNMGTALTPDFSVWLDIPLAAQLWQVYRARWLGAYWQANGVQVIPTITWADADSYDFVFDGIATGGTVATSSVGAHRDWLARDMYRAGIQAMVERIQPSLILSYGRLPDGCEDLDLPPVEFYPTRWDSRRGG